MKWKVFLFLIAIPIISTGNSKLGLPELIIPANNPQTPEKIALGNKLFNDIRFSSTGKVSCATCHAPGKGFTDSPLKVSEGIEGLTGTRNAPTVLNAAFNKTQFWDGRSPDLEDQSQHPFVNPVEMGLKDHQPILEVIAADADYQKAFEQVFKIAGDKVEMEHVKQAIAAFERTQIFGNSRFDQYYFAGKKDALSEQELRGFTVFLKEGRCISCHTVEQSSALFTDHKFHNIGVGVNALGDKINPLAQAFIKAKAEGIDVDKAVLSNENTSHLGRFAVNDQLSSMGAFKTPTLRNIALTAPYMHDGSLETLKDVVIHYNNGGASDEKEVITPFLSGGIRPLNLTDQQIDDLVAFMESLTSVELSPKQAQLTLPKPLTEN